MTSDRSLCTNDVDPDRRAAILERAGDESPVIDHVETIAGCRMPTG